MDKITANTILNLLLKKHSKDICVPECKNGSTWTNAKMQRADLWAMKKSYTKPMTWIYEIKISRQDFLNDNKWQGYLKYCTDFYFVAPTGIIDVSEVPEQAGLLLTSKTGGKLFCKKKAPHRDVSIPDSIYKYILMSRSKIIRNNVENNNTAMWKQWLNDKNENQELGYNVSKKIMRMYNNDVKLVKKEQNRLTSEMEKLKRVKGMISDIGFDADNLSYDFMYKFKKRIDDINEGFPEKGVVKHLESAILNLNNTIALIKKDTL